MWRFIINILDITYYWDSFASFYTQLKLFLKVKFYKRAKIFFFLVKGESTNF